MIISISGPAGSGKSTLGRMLAEKLGWPRYYIGGLRRQKAQEKGLTLAEYNKLGETDPATDKEVDEYQQKLGEEADNFIIEGRTSWHFIPQSFKIYIDVSDEEGVERIYGDMQRSELAKQRNEDKGISSMEEARESIRARKESDILRYKKYYGIDVYDKKNYDFVYDSTGKNIDEVFVEVLAEVEKRLKNK